MHKRLIPTVSRFDAEEDVIALGVTHPSPEKYPFSIPMINSSGATNASDGTYLCSAPCPTNASRNCAKIDEKPRIQDDIPLFFCYFEIKTFVHSCTFTPKFSE
ncbi:MAG: hypothetical protein WCJ61_08105 [Paludibacter sp.]